MSKNQILVGRNVREARRRMGWTQEQLASEAEISVQYLSQIERGQKNPSMKTLLKLAGAMQISMDLLSGNEVRGSNSAGSEMEYLLDGLNGYEKRVVLDFLRILIQSLKENRELLEIIQNEID